MITITFSDRRKTTGILQVDALTPLCHGHDVSVANHADFNSFLH